MGRHVKTNEEFVKEICDLVDDEYTFMEKYKGANVKMKIRHNLCNNIYEATASNFIRGWGRCNKCNSYHNNKKTNEEFSKEIYNLVGVEYVFLDKYVSARTKIRYLHNKCGNENKVIPRTFLNGSRCPFCSNTAIKTNEEFKKQIHYLVGNEYVFVEDYKGTKIKIRYLHNKCGNEWRVKPNDFINGKRCPFCSGSKGEKEILNVLNKHNINHIPQYKFNNCKNINPLPFDFYLKDLKMLIEYDGRQHYEPIDFFGGEETFKQQQINDNIKNTYCKENNIPLLRIPYWDYDNIESILEKELVKYGVLQKQITTMEMN